MADLICIGDLNLDIITDPIKNYPKKDEQIIVKAFKNNLGGSSAICASAAASLGLKTIFIAKVGSDEIGKFLIKKLKSFKVKPRIKIDGDNNTGITFAITFDDGKRSFISVRGTNAKLSMKDFNLNLLKNAKHLHISGIWHLESLFKDIKKILRTAKKYKLTTSIDIGATIEKERWNKIYDFLNLIDIIFLNKKELEFLAGKISYEKQLKKVLKHVKIIALHLGERGGAIVTKNKIVRHPAFKTKVVNPTGAGDVFNGGFLYGFLRKMDYSSILKYAIGNASLYLSRSEQKFPSLNELKRFIT